MGTPPPRVSNLPAGLARRRKWLMNGRFEGEPPRRPTAKVTASGTRMSAAAHITGECDNIGLPDPTSASCGELTEVGLKSIQNGLASNL
jgi:hypothetical protein